MLPVRLPTGAYLHVVIHDYISPTSSSDAFTGATGCKIYTQNRTEFGHHRHSHIPTRVSHQLAIGIGRNRQTYIVVGESMGVMAS
jgi:hypothetical protein